MDYPPEYDATAIIEGLASGLVGTLAFALNDLLGTELIPRTTSGILEPVPGTYTRTFFTPANAGSYLVVWDTAPNAAGRNSTNTWTEQIIVQYTAGQGGVSPLPEPYSPTLEQVAAWILPRTKTAGGAEIGTFSDQTRPTADQVAEIMRSAQDDVESVVGTIDPSLSEKASQVIALRAAMLIELRYFSEQIQNNRSPYPQLKELYEGTPTATGELKNLVLRQESIGNNDTGPIEGSGVARASLGGFPDSSDWMTRRM